MISGNQLKLLLWKDFLVRRRHLGVATLVFGWAIAVFIILYIVRESVDLIYHPTCTYSARSLPSTGLFPFVQSFICNVDNKCNNISMYEEVPQYKNARLTSVAKQLEDAFTNETILNVVKSLPSMIVLLKAVGNGLDSPNLEGIFGEGIEINSLFENPDKLKRDLRQNNLDGDMVNEIFDSSLKIGHLFKSFASTDIGSSICDPKQLEKYLILQEPNNINEVSEALCNISGEKVPDLIQNIFDHADFAGLLEMIGKTVDHFTNYSPFDDLKNVVEKFLSLNFMKDNVPANLKLKEWLPDIIPLMKDINRTKIDTNFVIKSMEIIEPHFNDTTLYPKYKSLILHITDLIALIQNKIIDKGPLESQKYRAPLPKNFSALVTQIQNDLEKLQNPSEKDIHEKQEFMYKILKDTLNILPVFYLNTSDPWLHIGSIMDSLTTIIGNKYLNQMSVISYIYSQSITALQNTLKHEYGSEKIMYSLCEKHSHIVSTLFSLGPEFITKMLHCFGNITCTSIIVANKDNISQIFCDASAAEVILPGASIIKNIENLCNLEIGGFIDDLILEFDLDWINNTVINMKKRIEKDGNNSNFDSFTSGVASTKIFVDFVQNRTKDDAEISWEQLFPDIENSEWKYIANEARRNAGIYIINVQLSYLKEILKNKTDFNHFLNSTSILMEGFLNQINLFPKSLMESVFYNLLPVVETIIRTFTNKTQLMTLASVDDWEQIFCNAGDENINTVAKIVCEKMRYIDMQNRRPWFTQPLISSIFNIMHNDYNPNNQLNWEQFDSDAQNMYLTLSELLNMKIRPVNWRDSEVFHSDYWLNWFKSFDTDTGIKLGVKIISKLGDFIERNHFDHESKQKWDQINTVTSSMNQFISFVLDITNFAISIENNPNEISKYPQTYNLSQILLKNFDVLIMDLAKIPDDENIDPIGLQEMFVSPCTKTILEILPNFSAQSAYTLIQIQGMFCNSSKFENEWGASIKADTPLQKMQATVSRFSRILHEVKKVTGKNKPFIMVNLQEMEEKLNMAHKEIKFEKIMLGILNKILEGSVLRQDALRDLWKQLKDCQLNKNATCKDIQLDTARHTAKFINAGLLEICETVSQYLQLINGTDGVDPLRLIGFSEGSGIYTLYLKFSDFIKIFIYTYRSSEFEDKVFEQRSKGRDFKCFDVMDNLIIPEDSSVTRNDIDELKRYFCPSIFDLPILQDNIFLRTITKLQDLYVDTPVSKLNISFVHVSSSLFDLKSNILDMYKYGKVDIKHLWSKIWTQDIKNTFEEIKRLDFNSNNTITRYFKYIDVPEDELNISINLINPKYGFGEFSYLHEKFMNSLNDFSSLNITSDDLNSQEDIEELQNLVGIYTKQVASFLSYIYYTNPNTDFWDIFEQICMDLNQSDIYYPLWIKAYEKKFTRKLCNLNDEEARKRLIPSNELKQIKNYDINLEEIIIKFLETLQNFVRNNSTIYLSETIKNYSDVQSILNHTFPTEAGLRNTSLEWAQQLSEEPRWAIIKVDEHLQATTVVLKLLQGGNWWETLVSSINEPTIKFWFQLLEKIPNIMINLSDAAISPRLLYEITSRVVKRGPLSLCNEDFNIKRYLKDENIVSIMHEACFTDSKRTWEVFDSYVNETDTYHIFKQERMAQHIFDFKEALIDLVKQGPKKFDVPKWMNESEIIQDYKDYSIFNTKPLKLLQTSTTVITEIIDIGSVFYTNYTNSCTWCSWATILVREASRQLLKAQKYADFLCNAPDMNFTQIKQTLMHDFKWGDFYDDVVGNQTYTVKDFDEEIHDIVDVIRIQLITFYTNKTLKSLPEKCFKKIVNTPGLKNISTYISAVKEITNTLKNSSVGLLKTPLFSNISQDSFSNLMQIYIPIFQPFAHVLKNNNTLQEDLRNTTVNNITSEILWSEIDVNTLHRINNSESLKKYFSSRGYFNKLFSFDNYSYSDRIQNELKNVDQTYLAKVFYENIDEIKLSTKISQWRQDALKSFEWVTKIFESLEQVIFNGGSILQFISDVDFSRFSTGNFNISSLLKGILELLEKQSIEKLFQSLRELIRGLSPLIRNEKLENDLYEIVDTIENLKIFKSLGLLRIKYKISDLVKDWKDVKEYLITDIGLEEFVAENILNSSIDLSEIMSSQGNSLNVREIMCLPEELSKIVKFSSENPEIVSQNVSKILCNLSIKEIQNIATAAFKYVNLTRVMNKVMDSTVSTILSSANISRDEGQITMKNIGVGADLLPYLKVMISNISEDIKMLPKFDALKSENGGNESLIISPDLLSSASTLLCGRALVQGSNKLYKAISEAKDFNADQYDKIEQKRLPTDFCRNVYKDIVNMEIGKVIWAYIKPLLRGQILYAPNTPAVRNIIENANSTFSSIAELQDILFKITDSLIKLEDRKKIEHILNNIQDFLNSSIVQMAVQNVLKSTSNSNISLKNLNLKDMLVNSFGNSKGLSSAMKFGSDFLHCVLLDRFVGVASEEKLEEKAKILMQSNEFIAGIVFQNMESREKRSLSIPNEISYKIRMDIDSVPSTNYLKYKFWTPGPDSDFLDELRYFRGFIQLQDLIDNSIIKLKADDELPKWETLTQEVPYPCWTKDFFKSALAVSQTFQVCFFFGLIAVVAAAVRYVVWEKESGNTMVMNVMGLRYITHCLSWFIVTLIEMLFVIIVIFIILKAGGILPLTNSALLFLFLLDFGFSVIMFCCMISSIFNSASLAAVGSAILYLLSYMPYIIMISLETSLEFWSKMITNLSMSSSFCYGCLYMIRFELQGVGLQWDNSWVTPIPGDNMNFGLTCVFLFLDGVLYGIIGYLCSRRSQGENYLEDNVSSTNIVNDEPLKIGVTIKGLTKIYNSRKKTVKAIENIDITLHTGQVTTLLGHNGAGKTTLIKILTGMMQPSSGQIIINSEITENDKDKKRFLGVCPQGSVLISTMTPMEHLLFYAKLKTQRNTEEIMPEVLDMIDSMSLGPLSNEPVSHLSEGMRRRLCVAIAFIGKPKLVVLDEPSSGVDPVARRQIWDLVIRYKEGCTVLLTTHYLDEAELLSDRVVVLHKGKVLCSGSPLILRQSYGSGYKITVSYSELKEQSQISDTSVNALVSLVKNVSPNAFLTEIKGFIIDITVPFTSTDGVPNNFEKVALTLEDNQINLGFLSYNMNCATLEQVFLDLCEQADSKDNNLENADKISQLGKSYSNVFSNSIDELPNIKDDEVLIETGEKLTGSTPKKFFALLKKRVIHCTYDWRVIICALVLPTVFTAVAMGFSLIRPPNSNEPALKLTPELYKPYSTSFISVDTKDMNSFVNKVSKEIVGVSPHNNLEMYVKSSRHCKCENGMQQCEKSSKPIHNSLLKLPTANETVDWIIETQNEYIERRYGGWSLSDQYFNKSAMIVWYNNKGYHSMPSYLNSMNSAILRTISPGSSITTYSHPLKLSVDQLSRSSIAQHIADVGIAMVLLIAFSLVPASGSIYLVQERINEEKRMQLLCGVSPSLYWVVAFVWDMMVLLSSLALSVIVFKIFGLPVYVERDNMAGVSFLIFLYGWACIPFIHLAQRLFKDASMANMILFCICAFIGVSELTCLLLMDILGKTQFVADFRVVLHNIYLIFPQFVLGDGLVEISKNNIQAEILKRFHMDTYVSPLSWELMGMHYLSLFVVGIVLFAINLIIENEWFMTSKKSSSYSSETMCLEITHLSKVYKNVSGKHVAVDDMSLNVPFGQCLGLIGVNGAGKSTTFKMLTTELRPTTGQIFLQGREICRKPLYSGEMGYCPQCDALDPKLTVRQTLKLYLTLRGIENKKEILKKIMFKFELTNYANRKNENLSGGNRRKLCTALSIIGKTSLILMDEPTSGMDPYSRNLVGVTIQQLIKQNRSVILTSHSVEDCEALCSNVAVMINGKVICQGSPQNLKERFGSGYIISVRLAKPSDQDLLLELIKKYFPGAEMISRQYCSSQFAIPIIKTKISDMFNKMAKISQYASVEDFNLVQSSLDQVFINLANKTEATIPINSDSKPNMYAMDVF